LTRAVSSRSLTPGQEAQPRRRRVDAAGRRIDRIDFNAVERYIVGKLIGDKPLSARSINMMVTLLGAVLGRRETQADRPQPRQGHVLRATVKRANENLERADLPPLPDKLTPHSLHRTFCSLLYALGEDPGTVMTNGPHRSCARAQGVPPVDAPRRG
jgi:integrase